MKLLNVNILWIRLLNPTVPITHPVTTSTVSQSSVPIQWHSKRSDVEMFSSCVSTSVNNWRLTGNQIFRKHQICRVSVRSTASSAIRVGIIGTGPAAIYTAKYLLRNPWPKPLYVRSQLQHTCCCSAITVNTTMCVHFHDRMSLLWLSDRNKKRDIVSLLLFVRSIL